METTSRPPEESSDTVTYVEWIQLYEDVVKPYALRFQEGTTLPMGVINGDRYCLGDPEFDPSRFPNATLRAYNAALRETIHYAVGTALGWLLTDDKQHRTLRRTFDQINTTGHLVLLSAPTRECVRDYGGAFGKTHRRNIDPAEYKAQILLVAQSDYERYDGRLDEHWQQSWEDKIHPDILRAIRIRVIAGIRSLLG
jgi:hypothetical protein